MILSPETKTAIGIAAIAISAVGDGTYLWSIVKGRTQPHVFSWLVWDLIVGIVFAGQMAAHAGPAAWLNGYNIVICFVIVVLGWKQNKGNVTRGDWIVLGISLAGVPLWLLTKNPLWSICLETVISALIYYPTIRKSYHAPFSENAFSYVAFTIPYVMTLFAIENYSFATVLYPAYVGLANGGFVAMLLWRRRILRHSG